MNATTSRSEKDNGLASSLPLVSPLTLSGLLCGPMFHIFWHMPSGMQPFGLRLEASCLQLSFLAYSCVFLVVSYSWRFSSYSWSSFAGNCSSFAYRGKLGKACPRSNSKDWKQTNSTVSKEAPAVSKQASPILLWLLSVLAPELPQDRSRLLGRGCDEAHFSEQKRFQRKGGEAFSG